MSEIILTVVVPVYNAGSYLDDCIKSILSQSFESFTLLLIDDGSRDNSLSICKMYEAQDSRVRVVSQKNSGPGAARNRGIEIATTPWICFIDSDDVVGKDYLGAFFRRGIPSEDTLVMQGMDVVTESVHGASKLIRRIQYDDVLIDLSRDTDLIADYKVLHSGYPVLKLFNVSVIQNHGLRFRADISFHEDHVFALAYLQQMKCVLLSSSTEYKYIQHEGSLTSKIHPYKESLMALNTLDRMLLEAIERYRLERVYVDEIYLFLSFILLRTITYAYRGRENRAERLVLLQDLKRYDAMIRRILPLLSGTSKVLAQIYLYLPIGIQDILLNTYYCLR